MGTHRINCSKKYYFILSKKKKKNNKSKKQPDEFSSSSDEEFSESSEQQFSSDEMDEQSNSQTTNDRELSSAGVSEPTTISTSSTTGLLDVAQMLKDANNVTSQRATELVQVDAGHLLVTNTQAYNPKSLSNKKINHTVQQRGQAALQILFNEIFRLPVERAPNGAVVDLPKPTTKFPREKPLPEPKPETRWEKFAKIKGIKNKKQSKWDWDEAKQEWRPRWGYQKANNDMDDWVVEDNKGMSMIDPNYDPFVEKKERKKKQQRQEEANIARAEATTAKNKQIKRKLGATISLDAKRPTDFERKARLNDIIETTNTAQMSTASMGIFDKKLSKLGEKKIAGKRKRFDPLIAVNKGDEKARSLKIMQRVLTGGANKGDASVDMNRAVTTQRRKDHKTGQRTGEDVKKTVRDTQRRSKQGSLPQS